MHSGMWSYETFAELAIGAKIYDFIAREATDTRIERGYALGARRAYIKRHIGAFPELRFALSDMEETKRAKLF